MSSEAADDAPPSPLMDEKVYNSSSRFEYREEEV